MIAKLMTRKKSYERMMSIDDNNSMSGVHVAGRSPGANMVSVPDINQKKIRNHPEGGLTTGATRNNGVNRPGGVGSNRKLPYYDSTP